MENREEAHERAPSASDHTLLAGLSCIACGRSLVLHAEGHALRCPACARSWPLRERTPFFDAREETPAAADPLALLHAPARLGWEELRRSLEQANATLHGEVFDFPRDDPRFLLPLHPRARVLVLGCGWGRFAASLAGQCGRVYAQTPDAPQARFVNARALAEGHANLLGVAAAWETLPYPTGSFDLVVLGDPGQLAAGRDEPHRRDLLRRVRALLKPEGALLALCQRRSGADAAWSTSWRWERLLARAGFNRVEDYLALPNIESCSYLLRTGQAISPGAALQAFVLHHLEPKSMPRRIVGRVIERTRLPGPVRWAFPGHWLIATTGHRFEPAVFAHPDLPGGSWGLIAVRRLPFPDARVYFAAIDPRHARARFVVKVRRTPSTQETLDREIPVLEQLHAALPPDLQATIPRVLSTFTLHGCPAVAQTHLSGRVLATLIQRVPPRRKAAVAATLLERVTPWLVRFNQETAQPTVITPELLDTLVLEPLRRATAAVEVSPRARELLSRLAADAKTLLGKRLPLVCEHGDFGDKNILLEGRRVHVVDWEFGRFGALPLGDLYELIHALAWRIDGDRGWMEQTGEMLRRAYGGKGTFSRAVRRCLERYGAQLGIAPEVGAVLLPVYLTRKAVQHAERGATGKEYPLMSIGVRLLESPADFPVVMRFPSVPIR